MISQRERALLALLSMTALVSGAQAQVIGPGSGSGPVKAPTTRGNVGRLFPKQSAPPSGGLNPGGFQDPRLSPQAQQQIAALVQEKRSRTAAQRKISSQLLYASRMWAGKPIAPGVTKLGTPVRPDAAGRALVDIQTTGVTQDLLDNLKVTGAQVLSVSAARGIVRANLGLYWLESIAARKDIRAIKLPNLALTNEGLVRTEGYATHQSDNAARLFGITGVGSKIGVISDSNRYQERSQDSADLPENVEVLPGQDGRTGDDSGEGTAMMEIVYDMAPSAEIAFATAFDSEDNFANNILLLREAGCNIIVDDISYLLESPFQDGVIAQAVDKVTADGALYFSAAGNFGNKAMDTSGVWEGDFRDGGPATMFGFPDGRLNLFRNGNLALPYNLNFFALGIVHWSDPMGGSANDYDVYLTDRAGRNLMAASTDLQDGTQDPLEIAFDPILFNDRLYIVKNDGAADRAIRINSLGNPQQFNTNGGIWGHQGATGTIAVAAIDQQIGYPFGFDSVIPDLIPESFTSDGPRRIFYYPDGTPITPGNYLFRTNGGELRLKPEITAADGVTTNTPGFTPFYGTSAAAPHAAAITATLLEVNPFLNRGELLELYESTGIDLMTPGRDEVSGFGVILTREAARGLIDFVEPRSVTITNIGVDTADIAWKTPISADSTVTLTDPDANTLTFSDATPVRSHGLNLFGLAGKTTYTVDVESVTPSGNVYGFHTTSLTTMSPDIARLTLGEATGYRSFPNRKITVVAKLLNELPGSARNVKVTGATLTAINTSTPIPLTVGNIAGKGSATFRTEFPLQRFGSLLTLRVRGTFTHQSGKADTFLLSGPVVIVNGNPPAP